MFIHFVKSLAKKLSVFWFKLRQRGMLSSGRDCLLAGCKVKAAGGNRGNKVALGDSVSLRKCEFILNGGGNRVTIADGAKLRGMVFWMEGDGNEICIGAGTSSENHCQIAACGGTRVTIGADCMLSHDIYIRTTDSHPIFDGQGRRTNPEKDIVIGNHGWLGMQVLVLMGASVPDGCGVGARSVVARSEFEPGSVVAGFPARQLKSGIVWKRH